jgi:hypothetical protein
MSNELYTETATGRLRVVCSQHRELLPDAWFSRVTTERCEYCSQGVVFNATTVLALHQSWRDHVVGECANCGEAILDEDEMAEVYRPDGQYEGSRLIHAMCRNQGEEVA